LDPTSASAGVRGSSVSGYKWTLYDLPDFSVAQELGTSPRGGVPVLGCYSRDLVLARFVKKSGLVLDSQGSTVRLPASASEARCGIPDSEGISPVHVLSTVGRRVMLSNFDLSTGARTRVDSLPVGVAKPFLIVLQSTSAQSASRAAVVASMKGRVEILIQRPIAGLVRIPVPEATGKTVRSVQTGVKPDGTSWVQINLGSQFVYYELAL
jgi:hypothetical protein